MTGKGFLEQGTPRMVLRCWIEEFWTFLRGHNEEFWNQQLMSNDKRIGGVLELRTQDSGLTALPVSSKILVARMMNAQTRKLVFF